MPMSFPDLASLRRLCDYPERVPYREGETEVEYRERCAVWSKDDFVQAHEIRTGKGWDEWNDVQNTDLLKRDRKSVV